jgi:alpha-amylase/alpha-mannosidase (GH57 family)
MARYVCIHGHFYQPPRENPWLERVEMEEGATPYHDWNQRITSECYAPNAASRIMDSQDMILAIINNYSLISFNFGPTLLSWMERESPEVYRSILEADVKSRSYFSGHGSALAQPYNHIIMPLANRRDKKTQVIWGIRDFSTRFKRQPQGMWLPETAVDTETLETMAKEGIEFTLLAPRQASSFRRLDGGDWTDVKEGSIDTRIPYLCRLPSGKSIAIFFFNQEISNSVAFSKLLSNGEEMANAILGAFSEDPPGDQLVHLATDGETYGHHHKFGEMALSYCLHNIRESGRAIITNYGEHLARSPPKHEVRIQENTSWSCSHGIERWRDDCGCSVGSSPCQVWRRPLREAMDWLRDSLSQLYEVEASKYLHDPWSARDEYIFVILNRARGNVEAFLKRHSRRDLSQEEMTTVLRLLELQRYAMLMYTSCGWYFDDISGIEALQVMKYASRSIQLAMEVSGIDLEEDYLERLRPARSSRSDFASGEEIYLRLIKPEVVDLMKVGAHYAISSIFNSHSGITSEIYSYAIKDEAFFPAKAGKSTLLIGRSKIISNITWENQIASYAVLWSGGNMIYGGARPDMSLEQFYLARDDLQHAFMEGETNQVMASITDRFKAQTCAPYSLKDLFKDKQVEVINKTLLVPMAKAMDYYSQIFKESRSSLETLTGLGAKPPLELQVATDVIFTKEVIALLAEGKVDLARLESIIHEIKNLRMELGKELIALEAQKRIESDVDALAKDPQSIEGLRDLERLISILFRMDLPLNLWRAQNKWYFLVGLLKSAGVSGQAGTKNSPWPDPILRISEYLRVRV